VRFCSPKLNASKEMQKTAATNTAVSALSKKNANEKNP
jgi:hypothetical protein